MTSKNFMAKAGLALCCALLLATLPAATRAQSPTYDDPPVNFQDQIYIVSGTLGGILLITIILLLILAFSVNKLKAKVLRLEQIEVQRKKKESLPGSEPLTANATAEADTPLEPTIIVDNAKPLEKARRPPEDEDNRAFVPDEVGKHITKDDLDKMGYQEYRGNHNPL